MIDDGKFAMSIIGYRRQGSNIKLVFADPHILNNRNDHGVGLYAATYTPLGEMVNL